MKRTPAEIDPGILLHTWYPDVVKCALEYRDKSFKTGELYYDELKDDRTKNEYVALMVIAAWRNPEFFEKVKQLVTWIYNYSKSLTLHYFPINTISVYKSVELDTFSVQFVPEDYKSIYICDLVFNREDTYKEILKEIFDKGIYTPEKLIEYIVRCNSNCLIDKLMTNFKVCSLTLSKIKRNTNWNNNHYSCTEDRFDHLCSINRLL